MRCTSRLWAVVKAPRYLEANSPTGLTGLATHPAPRSALLYLYSTTLEKLKALPESSVYRQSTQSLTRHRMQLVESIKPEGYDAWLERSRKQVAENPEMFNELGSHEKGAPFAVKRGNSTFAAVNLDTVRDTRILEWDGEENVGGATEGTRTEEERDQDVKDILEEDGVKEKAVEWEPEPQLDADQISELENKIGGGLIEEVIQVAEGELGLVDIMAKARPWEELEEKPAPGQWEYFERLGHTGKT